MGFILIFLGVKNWMQFRSRFSNWERNCWFLPSKVRTSSTLIKMQLYIPNHPYAKNGSLLDTKPQTAKFESHKESTTEVKNARILNKGIRRGDRSRKRGKKPPKSWHWFLFKNSRNFKRKKWLDPWRIVHAQKNRPCRTQWLCQYS